MYLTGRGPIILNDFVNSKKTKLFVGLFSERFGGRGSRGGAYLLGKGTDRQLGKEILRLKIHQN
jgi:hypothetical protein